MLKKNLRKAYAIFRKFNFVFLLWCYASDFFRFIRYSGLNRESGIYYKVLMDLHRLEKGMSLPVVRCNYGAEVVNRILSFEKQILDDEFLRGYTVSVLSEHLKYLDDQTRIDAINLFVTRLKGSADVKVIHGGLKSFCEVTHDCSQLIEGRRSVRSFKRKIVAEKLLEQSVGLASKAPSVCNRQSSHTYIYQDKDKIDSILTLQNGNIGFRDEIYNLAIITSDMSAFNINGERNQMFVDGGMYSMNFILALYNEGIGSCCLNWAVEPRKDCQIHKVTGIPSSERIIMLVAFGYPKNEEVKVASSPRKKSYE